MTRRTDAVVWTFTYADLPPTVVTARLDADGALADWTRVAGGVEQTALARVDGGYAWRTRLHDGTLVEGAFDVLALGWPPADGAASGPTWTGRSVEDGDAGIEVDLGSDGLPRRVAWPDGTVFVAGAAPDAPLVTPDDLAWPADGPLPRPRAVRALVVDLGAETRALEASLAAGIPPMAAPATPAPARALPEVTALPGLPPAAHLRDQLRDAHALARRQLGSAADCKALAARSAGLLRGAGIDAEPVTGWVFTEDPTPAFRPHAWVRVRLPDDRWLPTDPALGQLVADATHVEAPPDLPPGTAVRVRSATWADGTTWPVRASAP